MTTTTTADSEKLSVKEQQELIKATEMTKAELEPWQKLEGRAKKLEAVRSKLD